jgi:hypothetical protein
MHMLCMKACVSVVSTSSHLQQDGLTRTCEHVGMDGVFETEEKEGFSHGKNTGVRTWTDCAS